MPTKFRALKFFRKYFPTKKVMKPISICKNCKNEVSVNRTCQCFCSNRCEQNAKDNNDGIFCNCNNCKKE